MSVSIDLTPLKASLTELLASTLEVVESEAAPLAEQIATDFAEAKLTGRDDLLPLLEAQITAAALVIRKDAARRTTGIIKGLLGSLFAVANTALSGALGGLVKSVAPTVERTPMFPGLAAEDFKAGG